MTRKAAPRHPIASVLGPLRADLAIAALEAGVQLRRLGADAWHVTSSQPGREGYAVRRDPGDLFYICDCPAGQHARACRHVALVQLVEATGAVEPIAPAVPAAGY